MKKENKLQMSNLVSFLDQHRRNWTPIVTLKTKSQHVILVSVLLRSRLQAVQIELPFLFASGWSRMTVVQPEKNGEFSLFTDLPGDDPYWVAVSHLEGVIHLQYLGSPLKMRCEDFLPFLKEKKPEPPYDVVVSSYEWPKAREANT